MIKGIDIYHGDLPFNWADLDPEVKFVFVKATEGATVQDPFFNSAWQYLKGTDKCRGAYHYLRPTSDPKLQAQNFLMQKIDFSKPGCLPPVLDVEENGVTVAMVNEWLSVVEAATGRRCIIYSYPSFLKDDLGNHYWPDNPLWIASYSGDRPTHLGGFKDFLFWQYSEFGTIDGKPTGGHFDLDYFNGTIEELHTLTNQ